MIWDFEPLRELLVFPITSVLNWVGQAQAQIPDENYEIPVGEAKRQLQTAQIDELQTLIGSKKNHSWLWTVVNSQLPGILKFVIGDRSVLTLIKLWQIIQGKACFLGSPA